MSLIKCKECNTEVSSKAENCPKCGVRIASKPMGCGTLIGVSMSAFPYLYLKVLPFYMTIAHLDFRNSLHLIIDTAPTIEIIGDVPRLIPPNSPIVSASLLHYNIRIKLQTLA